MFSQDTPEDVMSSAQKEPKAFFKDVKEALALPDARLKGEAEYDKAAARWKAAVRKVRRMSAPRRPATGR